MPKKYTPAIFQPTIRPSWAGIISYISVEERATILEAIIKYPVDTGIKSNFWEETIKPDLDTQYESFIETCSARGRGAKSYWGEHKLSISNTIDKHKDNYLKDKDKNKDKDKDKDNGCEYTELFNQSWSIYPKRRRESKKSVYPVWVKIIKDGKVSEDELAKCVKNYSTSEDANKDGGQYAKGFIAWLRGGCYSYEYKQPQVVDKKPVYVMDDGREFDHQPIPKWDDEQQQYIWE